VSDGFYTSGEYLAQNPTWHAEDSAWKASQVLGMLNRHGLRPRTVCEVGCGAGAVLRELHDRMDHQPSFVGYEISPQAFKLAVSRSSERLTFRLGDVLKDDDRFDLTLLIDVVEHVEDYFSLLRGLRTRSGHTMLHIPLELSVLSVLLDTPLTLSRDRLGHLHFFTRDIALGMIRRVGYEILDWRLTAASSQFPRGSWKLRAIERARRVAFPLSHTATVRIFGGYSLLVLCAPGDARP
jgi:SAM-dependent methyltransferase